MLHKLLNVHRLTPFSRSVPRKPAASAPAQPKTSSVLKIVHAGGRVEFYYMATPAVRILEKYPSFILARPEVFRRPWDSVVRPDEILTPGGKFFLVPRRTVKKLRRRIKRPDREASFNSFMSKFSSMDVSVDVVSNKDEFSCKSFCQQSEVSDSFSAGFIKKTATRKHVTFVGIEVKNKKKAGTSHKEEDNKPGKRLNSESHERRRAQDTIPTWQPSLAAINERTDE